MGIKLDNRPDLINQVFALKLASNWARIYLGNSCCNNCRYADVFESEGWEIHPCVGLYCGKRDAPVEASGLCDLFERNSRKRD